jgi:mono/diheme cytochrome c family protein
MGTIFRARVPYVLGMLALLCGAAHAENLDAGKSGPRLFADSCAACHHSARGLTKGRFRLTLYLFLQQHYASNSSSAWELSSYLESVDDGARSRPRAATSKHGAAASAKTGSSLRPPASVPLR